MDKRLKQIKNFIAQKLGGPVRAAKLFDVGYNTFYKWSKIPEGEHLRVAVKKTDLSAHEIRPDLFRVAKSKDVGKASVLK